MDDDKALQPRDGAKDPLVSKWSYEIDRYEKRTDAWERKCKVIGRRYTDDNDDNSIARATHRFNAFWSNVQTQLPAMYAQIPKPEVDRRFKDADPVGRAAAELLQRCTSFSLSSHDNHPVFKQAVLDYLLYGRGTLWVRYCPSFKDLAVEVIDRGDEEGEEISGDESQAEEEPPQDIDFEEVVIDFVHRRDFGHTEARTWEELRAVWRRTFLTRDVLVKRFGADKGERVPLNHKPDDETSDDVERERKAVVYEIWDRTKGKAIWICKDFAETLDEKDDPLKLRRFFPCPRPLFATLNNDSLTPTPDYVLYQDQLNMLDELTARITSVTKSLKVAGCYDASAPALQRILNEGQENTLIPVDSWAALAEKGGLAGVVSFLPIELIAAALLDMYQAREQVKSDMYEITGLSDLTRGDTDPDETAAAQKLKGQFVATRFSDRRADVQHFLRDVIQITTEIIAEQFATSTLKVMSGLQMFDTAAEKAQALAMYPQFGGKPTPPLGGQPPPGPMAPPQPGLMGGQQPMQPPVAVPDEVLEQKLTAPTWEEVIGLIRNDALRSFRIDIETDSTIRMDEEVEQAGALEYAKVVGGMIKDAGPMVAQAPQLGPLIGEMLLFVSRRFKIGRQLEGELENAVDTMKKAAANPPPKQAPIEIQKIQAQGKVDQANIQAKAQADAKSEQSKAAIGAQVKLAEASMDAQSDAMRARNDIAIAQSEQEAQGRQAAQENAIEAQRSMFESRLEQQTEALKAQMQAQQAFMQQQFALLIAQMNNRAKIEVAEIAAETTLEAAQVSAAAAGSEE